MRKVLFSTDAYRIPEIPARVALAPLAARPRDGRRGGLRGADGTEALESARAILGGNAPSSTASSSDARSGFPLGAGASVQERDGQRWPTVRAGTAHREHRDQLPGAAPLVVARVDELDWPVDEVEDGDVGGRSDLERAQSGDPPDDPGRLDRGLGDHILE